MRKVLKSGTLVQVWDDQNDGIPVMYNGRVGYVVSRESEDDQYKIIFFKDGNSTGETTVMHGYWLREINHSSDIKRL